LGGLELAVSDRRRSPPRRSAARSAWAPSS